MADDPRIEVAYNITLAQLDAQFAKIDELRTRVGTLLSGAAIATGFLAGQTLDISHGISPATWVAIVAAFGLVACCAAILWPRTWEAEDRNGQTIIDNAKAAPQQDMDSFREQMVGFVAPAIATNNKRIAVLYHVFSFALLLLCADFGGWIWTLTHNR